MGPVEGNGAPTRLVESRETVRGVDWTNDGAILYPSGNQLLVRATDGRERSLFVSDRNSPPLGVHVCRSSGQVVFVWPFRNNSTAQNIWRINGDGNELQQLTDVPLAGAPACSPDGEWLAFQTSSQIFRMRTSGGPTELLAPRPSISNLDWSPDGSHVAFLAIWPTGGRLSRALMILTPGESGPRLIEVPDEQTGSIAFTPDGSGIAYIVRRNGTDSIQVQPLDGSPPRTFMTLAGAGLSRFRWSPDGSKLAGIRQRTDSDVVLLRDGSGDR